MFQVIFQDQDFRVRVLRSRFQGQDLMVKVSEQGFRVRVSRSGYRARITEYPIIRKYLECFFFKNSHLSSVFERSSCLMTDFRTSDRKSGGKILSKTYFLNVVVSSNKVSVENREQYENNNRNRFW